MIDQNRFAVETDGLTRYFERHCVVDRLNFQVPVGKVTALLGLNGAGKTTTIRMMMGLLDPTRGTCRTLGADSQCMTPEVLQRIGYMVEGHYLAPWMRVNEVERFSRAGHQSWDSDRFATMIDHFAIGTRQRVGKLSRGQRAGVSLASVLAADPELLILDDPALGLDPVSRRALNETLVDFAGSETNSGKPRTVLLSTHMMDDVERIADDVAVMVGGKLLVQTKLDDFLCRVRRWSFVPSQTSQEALVTAVRQQIPGAVEIRFLADRCVICVADPADEVQEQLAAHAMGEVEALPTSLNELVIAYLSTQRRDSFRQSEVN